MMSISSSEDNTHTIELSSEIITMYMFKKRLAIGYTWGISRSELLHIDLNAC